MIDKSQEQNTESVNKELKYKQEVCEIYSQRMHRKNKLEFRNFLQGVASNLGMKSKIDNSFVANNVVVGDPEKAEYIFTAHYDTPPRLPKFFVKKMLLNSLLIMPISILALAYGIPALMLKIPFIPTSFTANFFKVWSWLCVGTPVAYMFGFLGGANKKNTNDNSSGVLTLLNIMEKIKDLPENQKDKVCFVFFDNEEKGLLGSISFRLKYNKVLKNQKIINFDCVGLGKQVNAYHLNKNDNNAVDEALSIIGDDYNVVSKRTTLTSLSDHVPFGKKLNCTTLLCVDKEDNKSLYSQIHSTNDTKLDDSNITQLSSVFANHISISTQLKKDQEAEEQKDFEKLYSTKKHLKNTKASESDKDLGLEM